ncbi:MAG: DUF1553 domain-containing protein, partial [Isosphaeraceae bacterium]|nr:DUF1553 domain-containing protein [Isosphaeraceae bacterium]
VLAAGAIRPAAGRADEPSPLARRVRPILARCVQCHGRDEPAGELDLSTREAALRGGESGTALAPADAARSLLFRKVTAKKMPPKDPLPDDQIALVRAWIDAGAVWESPIRADEAPPAPSAVLWALKPLGSVAPPRVKNQDWVADPIDAFILARLEAERLAPAPEADRLTLIRRATFDLTGLPPTPAEIDAFANDKTPTAYESLIDRLLASPHYGERWGRHWLDVARFSESHGFEYDRLRDNAWHYRDYVIARLNADAPYARFVQEQIAGDVLEPVTPESIAATGFLVSGPWDEAGNKAQKSVVMRTRLREEELEDMVSAVGQTFLGLTVNCARCHDHKFDPIPQRDYYRMKAALAGVQHGDRPAAAPAELAAREERRAELTREIRDLETESARLEGSARSRLAGVTLPAAGVHVPLVRWTFEKDERDEAGLTASALAGGASVRAGRLHLDGRKAYLKAGPLPRDLSEKTLEAWLLLPTLSQGGGGVLSVERRDGSVFDAIVFGEREPAKWVAGSDFYRRSRDLAAPAETAKAADLIQVAAVYDRDGGITVYRNGSLYAPRYVPSGDQAGLRTFPAAESEILLGLRHTGAGNGYLTGEVEEARVYDAALSAAEIATSFQAGVAHLSAEQIQSSLSPEENRRYERVRSRLAARRSALDAIGPVPLAYAANAVEPPATHVLSRGDVEKPAALVAAGALSAVKAPSADLGLAPDAPEGLRRRKLAEWVVHPDNPLTPRVIVNRVWHYHFGTGLVATPNDFGTNGEKPSHPELLDWLARDFLVSGTRLKALHRRIMLSSTYRQSSRFDAAAAARDAETRLLWRFPPRRLEAEAVRDAMLSVSGRLQRRLGGPSFRPFTITVFNSSFYNLIDSDAPDLARRSVYRINVNSAKDPLLDTLDCPDPSIKTPRRAATTTPLQALALMNDAFVLRQARHAAERVRHDAGTDVIRQADELYRLVLGRPPRAEEASRGAELVRNHGLESLAWVLFNANEFLGLR